MIRIIGLSLSLMASSISFANINLETETQTTPLESTKLLHSLQQLQDEQKFTVPTVNRLNNKHKVRTYFVASPSLPIVDIQLTFNAGSWRDREIESGLYGVANMAAQLMDEGTPRYNANEIAAQFEDLGAQFSVKAHRDMFVIKLRVLSEPEKINAAVELMLELINHSTFENKSIDLVVSNTQVGQKQLQENSSRLMSIRFYRELYGKHPYAEPITGTQGSIKKITPTYLKNFRDQFLVRDNLNLAITGQLSHEQALKLSEKITGALDKGLAAQTPPPVERQQKIKIIHLPSNSTQATVTMGHIGTDRNDPDRLALEIANRILGNNSFNSRLMQELRVKRGYTYGASSAFSFMQSQGTFSVSYSTQQDQLMDSLRVAHQTLVDFVREPIQPEELEQNKLGMLRAFPNLFSSNAVINGQLGSLGFYGESEHYLKEYSQKLQAITAQDVQDAVRRHIQPDRLTIIVASRDLDQQALNKIIEENLKSNDSSPQVSVSP